MVFISKNRNLELFLLRKDVSLRNDTHGAIASKYVNVTDEKLRRRHGGEFDDVGRRAQIYPFGIPTE